MDTPTSEDELSALVRTAAAERKPIYTTGSGTKAHVGPRSSEAGLAVSMRGLARVVSYEPGDMVVTVQAGARLGDVQAALAAQGQWLPVDPPYADATIGGVIATASTGPRRLGYGTLKDCVLGARMCGADGVVTKSGGRVVKNVTGFDLHKLQWGAMGTLSLLVEVNLKVAARPALRVVFIVAGGDLGALHAFLLSVAASPLRPVALEALAGDHADDLRARVPGLPAGPLALVGVEGIRTFVERHRRDLRALTSKAALPEPAVFEQEDADRVWTALRDRDSSTAVVARIAARPRDLPALLAPVTARAVSLSAGSGIARITLPANAADAAAQVTTWHQRAATAGGYALVESAPLDLPGRDRLPFNPLADDLLRSVPKPWDPEAILNRGRMAL